MTGLRHTLAAASIDGRILKAHGTGNDFVILIDMDDEVELSADIVAALCDRHRGVGADGVIRITAAVPDDVSAAIAEGVADAPVFMDYRNADGTIVEMCGNGVRVVAKVVHDHGLVPVAVNARLPIGTRAGLRPVRVMGDAGSDGSMVVTHVVVDMGPALQDADAVGLVDGAYDGDVAEFRLADARARIEAPDDLMGAAFAGVSMGNPHAVTIVDDVDTVALARFGPVIECHEAFADGVNVNVVQVVDDVTLRLRVWERGVGETQACGTGACASVAAMTVAGLVDGDHPVDVVVAGGTLRIERDDRGHMLMTGPAEIVGTVTLDDGWLAARLDSVTD